MGGNLLTYLFCYEMPGGLLIDLIFDTMCQKETGLQHVCIDLNSIAR